MRGDTIAGICATILLGFVFMAIGRDWFVGWFWADPLAAVLCLATTLALGGLSGWAVRGRLDSRSMVGRDEHEAVMRELSDSRAAHLAEIARMREEAEGRRAAEEAARAAELKAIAVRIEQLPVGEKLNVKMAYLGRPNKMGGKSADTFLKHSAGPLNGIVYAVPLVMGEIELKLTDDGRAAVEAHPECLDAVPKLKGE